jgi:large subunit ribosomal protein L7Ae
LGQLVNQKTAAVVALTSVDKADAATLEQVTAHANLYYSDGYTSWGGGILSDASRKKIAAKLKLLENKTL